MEREQKKEDKKAAKKADADAKQEAMRAKKESRCIKQKKARDQKASIKPFADHLKPEFT